MRLACLRSHKNCYFCRKYISVGKTRRRILIIDDEETLRTALQTYLELEGYDTDSSSSAEEVMKLDLSKYDLLLLDIMLGDMSGTDLAKKLKTDPSTTSIPIIFLTAKDSDDDMVSGLNLGADDYIAKPYSAKNLLARIGAVLRRSKPKISRGIICDRQSLDCMIDGRKIKLPRKEFELLTLLTENPGRIFTREEIMERIWPEQVVIVDRSIDVHITRIRGKIAPYSKHIVTRSGYGYGWQD